MSKKYNLEFERALLNYAKVDEATGVVSFDGIYASIAINIGWKGSIVSIPYSHAVWFLTHGRWPELGKVIDHINDDPMDNAPVNLAEISQEENQRKRRGRLVYRNYGTGKYGPGMNIYHDKRDSRYYVTHKASRGHGTGDLTSKKISLGGFTTLKAAELKVAEFLAENFPSSP